MLKAERNLEGIPRGRFSAQIKALSTQSWEDVFTGDAASQLEAPHRNGGAEGFVNFAADEPVRLRLLFPSEVKDALFRPSLRRKTEVRLDGRTLEFDMPEPGFGVLEVNYGQADGANLPVYTVYILGDKIADSPLAGAPPGAVKCVAPGYHRRSEIQWDDAKTLLFLPGLHEFEHGEIELVSGRDIHLERGAVLRAGIHGEDVENVKITGQGVLDGSTGIRPDGVDHLSDDGRPGFICLFKGRDILLDGFLLYNPSFWNIVLVGTERAVIRNHKALSWIVNNDGVQPRSCNDLLVENCFFKCNDDAIAIKTRRAIGMVSRNLVFKDIVLWNDAIGNALEIGHSSQGDLLESVSFENIEVVHGVKRAAIDIFIVDHSLVRDVRYEDIYVEGVKFACDFAFLISSNLTFGSDKERGRVSGVSIRRYRSEWEPQGSLICGNDETHQVENVVFEDIAFNAGRHGKTWKAKSLEDLKIDISFASGITLIGK